MSVCRPLPQVILETLTMHSANIYCLNTRSSLQLISIHASGGYTDGRHRRNATECSGCTPLKSLCTIELHLSLLGCSTSSAPSGRDIQQRSHLINCCYIAFRITGAIIRISDRGWHHFVMFVTTKLCSQCYLCWLPCSLHHKVCKAVFTVTNDLQTPRTCCFRKLDSQDLITNVPTGKQSLRFPSAFLRLKYRVDLSVNLPQIQTYCWRS